METTALRYQGVKGQRGYAGRIARRDGGESAEEFRAKLIEAYRAEDYVIKSQHDLTAEEMAQRMIEGARRLLKRNERFPFLELNPTFARVCAECFGVNSTEEFRAWWKASQYPNEVTG